MPFNVAIEFHCPSCGTTMLIPILTRAKQTIVCKTCGAMISHEQLPGPGLDEQPDLYEAMADNIAALGAEIAFPEDDDGGMRTAATINALHPSRDFEGFRQIRHGETRQERERVLAFRIYELAVQLSNTIKALEVNAHGETAFNVFEALCGRRHPTKNSPAEGPGDP